MGKKSNVVVFAGAGASRGVSELYPTTAEFFQALPNEITANRLYRPLVDYLQEEKKRQQPDIEDLLGALEDFQDSFWAISDSQHPAGRLVSKGALTFFEKGTGIVAVADFCQRVALAAEEFKQQIYEEVHRRYAPAPSESELSQTWIPLLVGLWQAQVDIDIFTTNYDCVIEEAIRNDKALVGDNRLVVNPGWEGYSRRRLNLELWQDLRSTHRLFTKLHGSIDWLRGGGEILHSSATDRAAQRNVAVYPGYKDTPTEEPFVSFHRYFQFCAKNADAIVFIGFAFRDEEINRLLEQAISQQTALIVLDPIPFASSEKAVEVFRGRARTVLTIDSPFNPQSVDLCLRAVEEVISGRA